MTIHFLIFLHKFGTWLRKATRVRLKGTYYLSLTEIEEYRELKKDYWIFETEEFFKSQVPK